MNHFTRGLITEWRRLCLPFENSRYIIAVSGGADSSALAASISELVDMQKLFNTFIVAHFNHGLRGEDGEMDQAFVQKLSAELGLGFTSGIAGLREVNPVSNTEQSAREARYRFLQAESDRLDCEGIITAHTINDQAETVLLNLIRGSGLDGLSGMTPVSTIGSISCPKNGAGNTKLIRPLLGWATREDTLDYANQLGIAFRQDAMNEDESFKRVKVRKSLIPILKEFNPKIVETLARTANIMGADAEILREFDKRKFSDMIEADNSIKLKTVLGLSSSRRIRFIRYWIGLQMGSLRRIQNAHLDAVNGLVTTRKSGRKVELPGKAEVFKRDGKLIFRSLTVEK